MLKKNTNKKETQKTCVSNKKANITTSKTTKHQIEFFENGDQNKPRFVQNLNRNGSKRIFFTPDGIVDNDQNYVCKWNSFEIPKIYVLPDETWHFDVKLNGKFHKNLPYSSYKGKKGLLELIGTTALAKGSNTAKNFFNALFQKYSDELLRNATKIPVVLKCGFTNNGWQLPDRCEIQAKNGTIRKQHIKSLQQSLQQHALNRATARKQAKKLYDATSVEYKDILFAWMIIAPFFDVLMDYTDLRPVLLLIGENSTGKTQIALLMTKKIWGNIEEVIAPNNIQSESRTHDYLSTSTFLILIDDVENLDPKILAFLKAYSTGRTRNQKKNVEQELVQDDEMVNPIVLTGNDIPSILNDLNFLSRAAIFNLTKQPTEEQKKEFKDVYNNINDGSLGKYILEQTKDWKLENILEIYNHQQPYCDNTRRNAIYRLITTGAELFEMFFGFSLEIDFIELGNLLNVTLTLGDEEILTTVRVQIQESVKRNHPKIVIHRYKGSDGVVYKSPALNDLRDEMHKSFSLPSLRKILQRTWSNIPNTNRFTIKGQPCAGIFIPEEYWKETE